LTGGGRGHERETFAGRPPSKAFAAHHMSLITRRNCAVASEVSGASTFEATSSPPSVERIGPPIAQGGGPSLARLKVSTTELSGKAI
jgi:hypothetical protein